jgi:dihydroorotate dehydrogenase electron transfer subunit
MELKIIENREIAKNTYSLKIDNPDLFDVFPGQFFMVRVNDFNYPLLRRPFSVANYTDKYIEIIYRVVGEGTNILSSKKEGEFIDLLGPLGNGFLDINGNKKIFLVGGGIGVAPLIYLKNVIERYYKLPYSAYFGFNSADEVYVEFGNIATMDGSKGAIGNVVDLAESALDEKSIVFACGPTIMLKRLAYVCYEKGCDMRVSLESRMACGIGVCLGCVVETESGYKKVCDNGPVFDYKEIVWQAL